MVEFKCDACSEAHEPDHPDDIAVDRFFDAMKAKLAKKRDEGRGGWENKDECSAEYLSQLLREHIEKGDPIDVANFCMMLHQRGERITPSPQAQAKFAAELMDEAEACPICRVAFTPDDLCATDIELGICHAACLEGTTVVNLDTGEPMPDGEISTYRFGDTDPPSPVQQMVGIPEGWKLVPRTPTDAMMQAGLYQSSHDATWSDVYSSWVDMVDAAEAPPVLATTEGSDNG